MKKNYAALIVSAALSLLLTGCGWFSAQQEDSSSLPDSSVTSEIIISSHPDIPSKKDDSEKSSEETSSEIAASDPSAPENSDVAELSGHESHPVSLPSQPSSDKHKPKPVRADTSVIDDYENKYFVKKLNEKQKYHFCQLYSAAKSFKNDVTFDDPIPENELTTLMFLLNYECPELIHLSGDYNTEYSGEQMNDVSAVKLTYYMSENEYQENMKKLELFFAELHQTLDGKTTLEKEKYIYDYLFHNCLYSIYSDHAGSAVGSLIEGCARCEGLCKGFMWCMRQLGEECICVSGPQYWDPADPYGIHSWNIIKIDGNWYHLDVTVDNIRTEPTQEEPPNYGFFNANDDMIADNRSISDIYTTLGVPVCSELDENYHTVNGLLMNEGAGQEDINRILADKFDEEGTDGISMKFLSSKDYEAAMENIDNWVWDYLQEHYENVYVNTNYYNNVSKTIVMEIKKDIIEG